MALDSDIGTWHQNLKKAQERLQPLHDRMDATQRMIEEAFQIPAKEGAWDSYTSNDAGVLVDTATNIIGNGEIFTKLPISYGSKGKRKKLSEAEQFVEGLFAISDQNLTAVSEATNWQSQQAWFAVNRGWIAQRVILYEEDGDLVPDLMPWDPRQTLWWPGAKGNLWVSHRRRTTVEAVLDEYGEEVTGDNKGELDLHDILDDEDSGVMYTHTDGTVGDWVKPPERHGIGHLPVLILPVGNRPFVVSESGDDLVNVGKDLLFNDRLLIPIEERIGSYLMTLLGKAAKQPMTSTYDSTLQGSAVDFDQDPSQKGGIIALDIGKGESLSPTQNPEFPRYGILFWENVQRKISIGGLTAVVHGVAQGAPAGVTVQQLTQGALKVIFPFLKTVEKARSWAGNEFVRQFNALDKSKGMTVSGTDRRGVPYSLDRKPGDLPGDLQFDTRIVPNILQDQQTNLAMGTTARTVGPNGRPLLSDETIRDEFHLVQDTDAEDDKIDREKVYGFFGIMAKRVLSALRADGDDEDADILERELAQQQAQEQQPTGPTPQPGGPPTPTARIGQIKDQPNLRQRAMNRLKGLGR
jgi:hypothetical protein